MRVTFLLLLFALSAFGQPAPINRRAMAIAGLATTPTFSFPDPTNLWINLQDMDLALGSAPNWTDRVHGIVFTNTAKPPIMGASGLQFYGTNFLKLKAGAVSTSATNSFFIAFRNTNSSTLNWKTLLGSGALERGLMLKALPLVMYDVQNNTRVMTGNLTSNKWYYVVYTGGTNNVVWTNDVESLVLPPLNTVNGWGWDTIGANQSGTGDPWLGFIRCVVWWTNAPGTPGLTTNDAHSIFQWATNNLGVP